jgi:DNA replication licensing factor MCM4
MEQQTVSVAKAGIICSLNARTSVLAAANPKESRYNDFISIVENIQLPPTLLSRFDLIFLLRDIPDPNRDMQLARHIVSMHFATPKMNKAVIDTTMLTKYISYAKNKIQPKITEEAAEKLIEGYIALRRIGSHKKQITATTRQLESLVRLSEAHARMRLSEEVVEEDVDEALRLVRVSIFKAATDPKSGQVDIDLLTTGMNREQREEMQNAALDDEITPSMDDPLM